MTAHSFVFAENLMALKERSGKSWADIAHALGYKEARYLLLLASGVNEPRPETARKIADYFDVEWQSMFEDGRYGLTSDQRARRAASAE